MSAAEVFRAAIESLRGSGAPFMLVGATALGAYTLPRTTYDFDFLVADDPAPLRALRSTFALVEEAEDVFFDQRAFIFELPTHVTPVEVFVAGHWLTRQALERRTLATLPVLGEVAVPTPEDFALLKVAVATHPARPGYKRASDEADLGLLCDTVPGLDLGYVAAGAARLGPAAVAFLKGCGYAIE